MQTLDEVVAFAKNFYLANETIDPGITVPEEAGQPHKPLTLREMMWWLLMQLRDGPHSVDEHFALLHSCYDAGRPLPFGNTHLDWDQSFISDWIDAFAMIASGCAIQQLADDPQVISIDAQREELAKAKTA